MTAILVKHLVAVLAALCLLFPAWGFAQAQLAGAFPGKPVRLVLPVPAGGLQDGLARALAFELSKSWGQQVLVENRPGASGIIAADIVAKAPADGYTVFMTDNVTWMANQFLRSKLPYDPVRDFAPVAGLVVAGNVLVAPVDSVAKSLQELIAMARAKPGHLNYGSFGLGSSPHVDTEALSTAAAIRLIHVPYKGGPEILQALMGGQIAFSITGLPPALPLIRQGRIKALAYGGLRRSSALPDVPTLSESGLPGFESSAWFGWMAPARTPAAIIEKIAADAIRVASTPEFRDKYILGVGMEPMGLAPVAFSDLIKADREKYSVRLKALDLKLD